MRELFGKARIWFYRVEFRDLFFLLAFLVVARLLLGMSPQSVTTDFLVSASVICSLLTVVFIILYAGFKVSERLFQTPIAEAGDLDNSHESDVEMSLPTQWSIELIRSLDWLLFEKLCMIIWKAKGYQIEKPGSSLSAGVDFYLCSRKQKDKRLGVVKCFGSGNKSIDVKAVRELLGVRLDEELQLASMMYSGKLDSAAEALCGKYKIPLLSDDWILQTIQTFSIDVQQRMLKKIVIADYQTPSCPNCRTKLVLENSEFSKTGIWLCSNSTGCQFSLPVAA